MRQITICRSFQKWLAATFAFAMIALNVTANAQSLSKLDSGSKASFRGIEVVSKDVCWVSGSEGTVLRTTDGGDSWTPIFVPDSDELDFRDIQVLSDGSVILMSIGNGATSRLLRSTDNGQSWNVVLQNHDDEAFFDGIDFHPDGQRGALFGDPIKGRMDIYLTHDGGAHWKRLPVDQRPQVAEDEYGFAASGTGIIWDESGLRVATGGSTARILTSLDEGKSWQSQQTPLLAGRQSAGVFSMAIRNKNVVLVGGDYLKPQEVGKNAAFSTDFGITFDVPVDSKMGHKACVRFVADKIVGTCGRTGVELSNDSGRTWRSVSDQPLYTLDVDSASGTVFLAGPNGTIYKLVGLRK